jgi:subtilisin family serine protease
MYADFENNMDGVSFVNDPSGHVPSSFTSGSALYGFTGSTGGSFWQFDIPVRAISRSYSFGFEMITSPTVNRDGMTLLEFDLNALKLMPDRYEIISGTSMAAPFVSGVAAMLKAKSPGCSVANMKLAIYNGATTTFPGIFGTVAGNRFLNAQGALNNGACP